LDVRGEWKGMVSDIELGMVVFLSRWSKARLASGLD
jgi:hypothetical protein